MRPFHRTSFSSQIFGMCVVAGLAWTAPLSAKDKDTSDKGATGYVIRYADQQSEANTEILIRATPAQVWSVLTDFASMPSWSTSFQGLTGDIRNGGAVTVRYRMGTSIAEYPYTLTYADGSAFAWSAPMTGLRGFTDNHRFAVVPVSKRVTRFIQRDGYTGESSLPGPDGQPKPLTAQEFAAMQVTNFAQFNKELRAEVEKRFSKPKKHATSQP